MPTSTIDGQPAYNLGPLTSTWSAPSSCYTNGFNTALAATGMWDDRPIYSPLVCRAKAWDGMDECYPDGEQFMSIVTSLETKPEPTYGAHYYHSPGLACPSGWFTAGTAVMGEEGDAETSGTLFPTFVTRVQIYYKPWAQSFIDGLDPGETAIWCCPEGYELDAYSETCFKALEADDFTATTICREEFLKSLFPLTKTVTIDGTAHTVDAMTWEGDRTLTSEVLTTSIGPEELDDEMLTPVVMYPVITMVHREGDNDNESNNNGNGSGNDSDNDGGDNEGGDSEGSNDGSDGNGNSAAGKLMDAGLMAAVVGAAGVLGAALVL